PGDGRPVAEDFRGQVPAGARSADLGRNRGGRLVHQPREGADDAGDAGDAADRDAARAEAMAGNRVREPAAGPPAAGDLRVVQYPDGDNLRSMHNLDALMATTGEVAGEIWSRCRLLGTGEAIVSSPHLNRQAVVSMRPVASRRKFTR